MVNGYEITSVLIMAKSLFVVDGEFMRICLAGFQSTD